MPAQVFTNGNSRPTQQTLHLTSDTDLTIKGPTTNRAQVVVEILRHARPGSLTTTQVRQLIGELITLSDFDQAIHPLLVSDVVSERILGVYALMEKGGLTKETRKIALTDPSPYIRAEITTWLLQKHDFASLETLLSETISGMTPSSIETMVALASTHPTADVQLAPSRLGLGKGVPNYLAFLAERSDIVTKAVLSSLSNTQTPEQGKNLMLQTLASVRPSNYETLLQQRLEDESMLSTRLLLAQNLAATISETNKLACTRIESLLPQTLAGLEPVNLQYRETRLQQMRKLEQLLQTICNTDEPNLARIQATMREYVKTGRLLGPGNFSTSTLDEVTRVVSKSSLPLRDSSLSEALFEARRFQAKSITR
jgi:hypothetical protein